MYYLGKGQRFPRNNAVNKLLEKKKKNKQTLRSFYIIYVITEFPRPHNQLK